MRKWLRYPMAHPVVLVLILFPHLAHGQERRSFESHVQGGTAVFIDRFDISTLVIGAGGVEYRPLDFLGVGGEGALLVSGDGGGDVWSADVIGRFNRRDSTASWQPFVAAGYSWSLIGESDPLNIWRARVGFKRWTRERRGLILDFVQNIIIERGVPHYMPMFRIGMTFR